MKFDPVTISNHVKSSTNTRHPDMSTAVAAPPHPHSGRDTESPGTIAFSTTTTSVTYVPSFSNKKSFANLNSPPPPLGNSLDCTPRLAYLSAYLVVTGCALTFIFIHGWPLLARQVAPQFQIEPSTLHFQWVTATSATCEFFDARNSAVASITNNAANNITDAYMEVLRSGRLFVVHRHEQFIVAVLSILLDVSVLKYHFTHEPHPKFRLVRRRAFCIYAHIIGGTLEIFFALLAFLTGTSAMASLAAGTALLLQVPTSMFQAYSVFGAKRLLVPVAQLANAMHIFAAVRLLLQPISTEALLSMILVVHLYGWARFLYAVMNRLRILRDASYTLSITMSGILVIPSALEFVKTVHIFSCIVIYNVTFLLFTHFCCGGDPFAGENGHFYVASTRLRAAENVHVPPRMRDLGLHKASDDELARRVFDEIDVDGSGEIGVDEIRSLLRGWGLPPSEAHEVMASADKNGNGVVEFNEFRDRMRPVWVFGAKVMRSNEIHEGIFDARVA